MNNGKMVQPFTGGVDRGSLSLSFFLALLLSLLKRCISEVSQSLILISKFSSFMFLIAAVLAFYWLIFMVKPKQRTMSKKK